MKKLAPHDSSVKPLETVPAEEIAALDTRIALIQALIPSGLDAVSALLQEEVTRLAGPRYERKRPIKPIVGGVVNPARSIWPTRNCPSKSPGCVMSRPRPKCFWKPTRPYSFLVK